MQFRLFPVACDVDGVTHDPVLVIAGEHWTRVYGEGEVLLFAGPPTIDRPRHKGDRLTNGRPTTLAVVMTDEQRLVIGQSMMCAPCSARRHPLNTYEPAAVDA